MAKRQFIVGGNWKMNGSLSLLAKISALLQDCPSLWPSSTTVIVAPPSTLLAAARSQLPQDVEIAGQNVHFEASGAYTGEISANMLKEAGCNWVIVGHSERRSMFHESDIILAKKVQAVLAAEMKVIFCVGESLEIYEQGSTVSFIESQLEASLKDIPYFKNSSPEMIASALVVAYEPIWAIGTGRTASTHQAQNVHSAIRKWISVNFSSEVAEKLSIIYGGSVTAANCADLADMADIDGFLVGGASLKQPDFLTICQSKKNTE